MSLQRYKYCYSHFSAICALGLLLVVDEQGPPRYMSGSKENDLLKLFYSDVPGDFASSRAPSASMRQHKPTERKKNLVKLLR